MRHSILSKPKPDFFLNRSLILVKNKITLRIFCGWEFDEEMTAIKTPASALND
jgi:hypothetical protein